MYLIVTACKHVSTDLRTKETIKLGDQRGFFFEKEDQRVITV